ncbi:class I SAM-dependent methyltransferase [Microvirga splendida]|uniref:Class I SAM-dependent methyltransferase n=1 Tax=Microvirga splendida TaxID=2795727 RepID=A0ABS0Y6C3_9HYPH|nr:class I SAM-dependent methyltransferase [Microvirga splendida]MBJ6127847.1 class I SAM-dependent methyltransferase [Microvirga splendida]
MAATQFNLLTALGLRDNHYLLDIGCGSLRAGRLFIPYLRSGHYCGLEPEEWLVQQGIDSELGRDILRIKQPLFAHNWKYDFSSFGRKFDYMLAQSIFTHASASQITQCLQGVKEHLSPLGIFAVNFILGSEDYKGNEWVYPGCVNYTEAGMRSLVENAGLEMRLVNWPALPTTWMLVTHRGEGRVLREPTGATAALDVRNLVVSGFEESPEAWGYVDSQWIEGEWLYVVGWCRNPATNMPHKDVLVANEDRRLLGSAVTWISRPDVAEAFKEPLLERCGFRARIPASSLNAGKNELVTYAFDPDTGIALRLPNSPTVKDLII